MMTTPQSPAIAIPDAMVEAAARAMYELSSAPIEWDLLPAWLREIRCRHTRAALQTVFTPEFVQKIAEDKRDAEIGRFLVEKAFRFSDVELGNDLDGKPCVFIASRFCIPEPADLPYEEREWTDSDIRKAILAAIRSATDKGGEHV